MKIRIEGHELVEPEIQAVSLVRRGANRSPFRILKSADYTPPDYAKVPPQDLPRSGGPYAENADGPADIAGRVRGERLAARITDRHGAQAVQIGKRGIGGLDAIVRDAFARVAGRRR